MGERTMNQYAKALVKLIAFVLVYSVFAWVLIRAGWI